ncbi:hypothetical protein PYW08_010657 [Mythimna loreyi]|uniref:Uncharacterized protein n=1 Tax=Mythimna loreyi TaxID=667449 RepID=A0ACC2Q3V4_9NEOP|nr:hypothetical protein PYW08_010657 [Mythimna loreyi]
MVCITCGCSVRSVQRHAVARTDLMMQDLPMSHPAFHQAANYVCHPPWIRHQRHSNRDGNRLTLPRPEPVPRAGPETEPLAGSEPEPAPGLVPEPELSQPNYKRAANTSSHCVFNEQNGCINEQQLHVVPSFIKKILIGTYNFYIPRSARVCDVQLNLNVWHLLLENNNI